MSDDELKFDGNERIEAKWCIDSENARVEYLIDLKTSKVLMVRERNEKE